MAKLGETISTGQPARGAQAELYQRQVNIQPGGNVNGFQAAANNVAESHDRIAAIGASIAGDISAQRAQQAGVKYAQTNPGVEPLPVFTRSDKAFVDAYRQEEHNNIAYQGQTFLRNAGAAVEDDPTPQNLLHYQNASKQTIGRLLDQTTEYNRPDLERSLNTSYQQQMFQLSHQVEARNKQLLKENFSAASDMNQENMMTAGYQQNYKAIQEWHDAQVANINHSVNAGITTPADANIKKKALKIQEGVARNISSLMKAEKEGFGDSFLNNFANTPYPAYSPAEKQAIGQELYKQMHIERSFTAGQQQIEFVHAKMEVEAGSLTPSSMEDYRTKLSGVQFAEVQQTYQHQQLENIIAGQGIVNINTNSQDAAILAGMTDSNFNKAFARLVSQSNLSSDPILNAAMVAGGIKRNNPILTKTLEQAIGYGSPQEALSAASAVTYIVNQNDGVAVQTMDKQARSIGSLYELYARDSSLRPDEALKRARDQVLKQDPLTRETRIAELNTKLSNTGTDLPSLKNSLKTELSEGNSFSRGLGITDKTIIPDAAASAYLNSIVSYSLNGLDFKTAKRHAAQDVAVAYPPTHVNGVPERMAYSNMMPFGDDVGKNRESIRQSIADVAARNAAARNANQSVIQKLDWDGKQLKVNNVVRDVKVKADYLTDLHKGKAWVMYYVDDRGLQVNLNDVDPKAPNGIARWIPRPVGGQ